ncbi:hypothetical protein HK405_014496, partial [Cladochytrium tenue]
PRRGLSGLVSKLLGLQVAGTNEEVTRELSELYGAWTRFSAAHNVTSWLAHGALLGWYWGRTMQPWDDDVDVQMAWRDVARLAARHNGSVWEGRYLVDVNPNFGYRFYQYDNVIDARFVDMLTGRFVDVTALAAAAGGGAAVGAAEAAEAGAMAGVTVSCKSVHEYLYAELFPLRATTFEGVPALVPRNVRAVLAQEYGEASLTRRFYRWFAYDGEARAWRRVDGLLEGLVRFLTG